MKTNLINDIKWSIIDGKDNLIDSAINIAEEGIGIYEDVSEFLWEKFMIII